MLSALIRTEHSYRALPLAGQLVDQRFVHPGPLVTYSYITISADYIFLRPPIGGLGDRHIMEVKKLSIRSPLATQVVTGSFRSNFWSQLFYFDTYTDMEYHYSGDLLRGYSMKPYQVVLSIIAGFILVWGLLFLAAMHL